MLDKSWGQRQDEFTHGARQHELQLIAIFPSQHRGSARIERQITESECQGFFNGPVVHFYRNVFSHVQRPRMRKVAAMPKAIHAAQDLLAAKEKARRVGAKLREQRLTRAAELFEASVEETFGYYAFPEEH